MRAACVAPARPGVSTAPRGLANHRGRAFPTAPPQPHRAAALLPAASSSAGKPSSSSSSNSSRGRRRALLVRAADERQAPAKSGSLQAAKFNPLYLAIVGAFAALLAFRNPYIYAVLTVATILPQNSNVTSLNNMVLLFYESGLFTNFAEAVTAVRLVTWLSMGFMVLSFGLFN